MGMSVYRRPILVRLLSGLFFLLIIVSCRGKETSASSDSIVATVNGDPISNKEFEERIADQIDLVKGETPLKEGDLALLREEVLDRLIDERIMLQRAKALSLAVSKEELDARIEETRKDYGSESFMALFEGSGIDYSVWKKALQRRMLLEKVISLDVNVKIQVTEEEAERHFKTNRKTYISERRVHAVQIVVRDRDRAEGILKRLNAGEDFDKVAREVSIGPEAERGGDLGFFERGVLPETIDRVVFSIPIGGVSGIVESPYGFHIFKVLDREKGGGRKFTETKERVIADLRRLKEAEAYEHWIEELKMTAEIRISLPVPVPASPSLKQTGKH
jgi:parvulin-like peptidyl-prolyl isomerase